jgi:DNA-binding NarL/FixJ family response regulator
VAGRRERNGSNKGPAVFGNAPDPAAQPFGLQAWHMHLRGHEYALFSFPAGRAEAWQSLTPREQVVATEVLRGYSNAQVARRLGIASRTVANQVAAIFRKLGVCSRTELAAYLADSLNRNPPVRR